MWFVKLLPCFLWMTLLPECVVTWIHRQTILNDYPVIAANDVQRAYGSVIVGNLSRDQYQEAHVQTDETKVILSPKKKKPHIIFILADDLGYADIGYHNDAIQTPNIDRLAKRGVKLENYYSQQICAPSRAVLLTGKFVSHHTLSHNISPQDAVCLPLEHHLLPQELKKHGYSTHLVGKWHMGRSSWDCLPERRGFDSFLGIHGGGAAYVSHMQRYNDDVRGYALYNGTRAALEHAGTYAPEIYKARARDLIAQHNGTKSKPLFLFLSTQLVHGPNFDVPKHYLEAHLHHNTTNRATHSAQASILDGVVREVVRSLKQNNMWKNSVLMFSSDNGGCKRFGGRNSPLRGWKGGFFEGGVRVPGFIASPLLPKKARGRTFRGLMGISDWYSTIVKGILKKPLPAGDKFDSINMWFKIKNGESTSSRTQYLYSIGSACYDNAVDKRIAYRWQEWKYIDLGGEEDSSRKTEKLFLFNITADPYEKHNLASERPDMVGILQRKIVRNFCLRAKRPIIPNKVNESSPVHNDGIMMPWL